MSSVTAVATGPLVLLVSGAQEGPAPQSISPGLIGFLATFGLVLAVIVLFVNLTRRLRRLDHRTRQAEADEQSGAGVDGQSGDRAPGAGPLEGHRGDDSASSGGDRPAGS